MTDWDGDMTGDLSVLPPASTAATEASHGPSVSIYSKLLLILVVAIILQSLG